MQAAPQGQSCHRRQDSQPFPDLTAASSTRETPGGWEYVRTEEEVQGKGWGRRSCQSGSGQSCGSGTATLGCTSSSEVPRRENSFSGRRSDEGSCVGATAAMPRQPNLSLIPAERFDNNTVCRQGNPKCGVPPGKTWCWTWARAANTCEQVNSKMHSHRLAAQRLSSQHLKSHEDKEVFSR